MKLWRKTKEFCKEHKTGIIAAVAGVGGAIGGTLLYRHFTKQPNGEAVIEALPDIPKISGTVSEDDDWSWASPMLQTIVHYEKEAEEGNNRWRECDHQRDNWNKLVQMAEELRPGDGEFFVI